MFDIHRNDTTVYTAYRNDFGIYVKEQHWRGYVTTHGPFDDFGEAFDRCFDTSTDDAVWKVQ